MKHKELKVLNFGLGRDRKMTKRELELLDKQRAELKSGIKTLEELREEFNKFGEQEDKRLNFKR